MVLGGVHQRVLKGILPGQSGLVLTGIQFNWLISFTNIVKYSVYNASLGKQLAP
jgi:hypothetical protein